MPNWCRNQLVVKGDFGAMCEWYKDIKKRKADGDNSEEYLEIIQSVFPVPEELTQIKAYIGRESEAQVAAREKYGVADWYEWQRKHWGVQWGDCETRVECFSVMMYELDDDPEQEFDPEDIEGEHFIRYRFDTAWSPPFKAFERISKMFPTLHFHLRYVESGMMLKGEATFQNGDVITQELEYVPEWDDDYS